MKRPQTTLNKSHVLSEERVALQVNSPITTARIVIKLASDASDLSEATTFKRLLDCLSYALAIDETVNLATALGLSESLSNQEALSIWVKNETHGIQFLDACALFNFLASQLDDLVFTARRTQLLRFLQQIKFHKALNRVNLMNQEQLPAQYHSAGLD